MFVYLLRQTIVYCLATVLVCVVFCFTLCHHSRNMSELMASGTRTELAFCIATLVQTKTLSVTIINSLPFTYYFEITLYTIDLSDFEMYYYYNVIY